jgi:hypothetical protein
MRRVAATVFVLLLAGCFRASDDAPDDISVTDMSPPWDTGPAAPRDARVGGDGPDARIVAPYASRSRPICGPADGPAWSFEVLLVLRTFSCDEALTDERIMLEVFDDLTPEELPRTFEVGTGFGTDAGAASYCDGESCTSAERGTIEIVLFDPPGPGEGPREGLLRYELELRSGEVLASDATIPLHCEGFGGCG